MKTNRDLLAAPPFSIMTEPSDKPAALSPDLVFLHSPTEDGKGVRVVRARDERLEVGEVRPLEEGRPITGDVVRLKPREGSPRICEVDVLHSAKDTPGVAASSGARQLPGASAKPPAAHGPAQVASTAYRESWDRIFGPVKPPQLPN